MARVWRNTLGTPPRRASSPRPLEYWSRTGSQTESKQQQRAPTDRTVMDDTVTSGPWQATGASPSFQQCYVCQPYAIIYPLSSGFASVDQLRHGKRRSPHRCGEPKPQHVLKNSRGKAGHHAEWMIHALYKVKKYWVPHTEQTAVMRVCWWH